MLWTLREGEVRYAWTASQSTIPAYEMTKYSFTGQYSYMDDITTENVTEGFGLMYYNARMYDPALGRFTSADTIIPPMQGVQAWDRYAYVNNSPVMYTDPTGHCIDAMMKAASKCGGGGGGGGGGSSTQPPASSPQAEGDSLVNPDHCKKFGECDSTSSSNDSVNSKGPGLNMPSNTVNNQCTNWWEYCVTDISPDLMDAYWDVNVQINSTATLIGYGLSGLTAADFALMALTYFGVLAIDPEPISKATLAIGGILILASIAAAVTASDATIINNAIVETGALSSGGEIIATPWSVTINSTSGQTQTVPVSPGSQIVLWVWANSTLSP